MEIIRNNRSVCQNFEYELFIDQKLAFGRFKY